MKAEFGVNFEPVIFDVTDEVQVAAAVETIRNALNGINLDAIVNNAGASIVGPFAIQPMDEFRRQIEINLMGPIIVCRNFLPLLGVDPEKGRVGKPGKIINISSIGAHLATPFMTGYNAAKGGLEAFSHSLRRELSIFGVDVVVLVPGAFKSAIWAKTDAGLARYDNTIYREALQLFREGSNEESKKGLPGERMGVLVDDVLSGRKKGAVYPIMPSPLRDWSIATRLPHRMIDRLVSSRLGMNKKA
jgi:NAD(P)-dependent dehydrogenase (short-subunit alcohol dehydrogenase family)